MDVSQEHGISSETNEVTALRVKEVVENQSFSSIHRWFCTSHDLVLDPNNVLFDGEITEDDDDVANLGAGFYWDLINLTKVTYKEKDAYFNFISKYGTHYLAAARYGASGYKMHFFNSNTVSILESNSAKIKDTNSTTDSLGIDLKADVKGANAGGGTRYTIKKSNGTDLDSTVQDDLKTSLKDEKEISSARGAYTESGMDSNGEIHVFRNFKPLHTLLSPPYFADMDLVGTIRPKLKDYIDQYIEDRKKNFPRPTYKNVTRVYRVKVRPLFAFDPSPNQLIERQPNTYKGIPLVKSEQTLQKYLGSLKLSISIKGEKRDFSWIYNGSNVNTREYEFEIIKRSKIILDGSVAEPPLEITCEASYALEYNLINIYRGIKPEDKAKHNKEVAAGAAIGGSVMGFLGAGIGALIGHIHGHPSESTEKNIDQASVSADKLFNNEKSVTVKIADQAGVQDILEPNLNKYFTISLEEIELEASSLF